MFRTIHLIAAPLATVTIATFFVSTIVAELFGSHEGLVRVKSLIVAPGLFILVPLLAATGLSGFALSRSNRAPLVAAKMRRMAIIVPNGVLVLVPSAIALQRWASMGRLDTVFFVVQAIELLAGAVNLTLMGLNLRDGLRLSGRLRARRRTVP